MDSDITKALNEASFTINYSLFGRNDKFQVCYMLLAAHYLVTDLSASSQGIAGQYSWLTSSKSVGSVSEGISIPPRILENPELAMIAKTNYGARYIMFILPLLTGVMYTVLRENPSLSETSELAGTVEINDKGLDQLLKALSGKGRPMPQARVGILGAKTTPYWK